MFLFFGGHFFQLYAGIVCNWFKLQNLSKRWEIQQFFPKKNSQLVVWFSWNLVASSHLLRNPIDDRRKGVSSQGQAPNCQKGLVQQLKDEMVGKMHGNLAPEVQSV